MYVKMGPSVMHLFFYGVSSTIVLFKSKVVGVSMQFLLTIHRNISQSLYSPSLTPLQAATPPLPSVPLLVPAPSGATTSGCLKTTTTPLAWNRSQQRWFQQTRSSKIHSNTFRSNTSNKIQQPARRQWWGRR